MRLNLAHLAMFGRVIERTKNHRYRGLQLLAWHGLDMKLLLGVSPAWMQGFRLWGCNDVLNDFRFGDVSRPQEHDQNYCFSCIALVDTLYTLPLYIALFFFYFTLPRLAWMLSHRTGHQKGATETLLDGTVTACAED